jgi:hypothetical protein
MLKAIMSLRPQKAAAELTRIAAEEAEATRLAEVFDETRVCP